MSLLHRLFATKPDPREELRPLWHAVVAASREERWYADLGVEDSVAGRFDMIAAILCLVLLRMEAGEEMIPQSVLLTELFVEDMDTQLRESGINDVVVGKKIGRLMAVLGGRLGALRTGLAAEGYEAMINAVKRNVSLADAARAPALAQALRAMAADLAMSNAETILAGRIA